MEHIIVKELPDGYVNLTAEKGYKLFSIQLQRVVSEAVVKPDQIKNFKAIKE